MKIKHIANIEGGQDGAIFGSTLFRFDSRGNCKVYDISALDVNVGEPEVFQPFARFTLDRADALTPHSNSVVFGNEYYEAGDEFPLLYTNIYNTYKREENKMCGVCPIYRIERTEGGFTSTLVQIIKIGFTDNRELWRSSGQVADVRPYGNFVVDTVGSKYWAYVMRDGEKSTRYFRFSLPKLSDGKTDAFFGVPRVVLTEADIECYFDTPYHNFIQGGVFHNGKVYEVEGFGKDERSAIRVIDTEKKCEELYFDFFEAGYPVEPEFIDFYLGKCIYIDAHGNVFNLEFEN